MAAADVAFPEGAIQPPLAEIQDKCAADPSYTDAVVFCEVMADTETPLSAFLKVRRGKYSFLLESVEGAERVARYSFIGTEPDDVVRLGPSHTDSGDPMTVLEARLAAHKLLPVDGVPLPPFRGGAVGYVSYDAVRHFEPRVAPMIEAQADPLKLPEAVFMFVSSMLVFDRASHTIKVVAHCKVPGVGASQDEWASAFNTASATIKELVTRLSKPLPADPSLVSRAVVSKRIPEPPKTAATAQATAAASDDGGSRDTASSAKSAALDYAAWEAKSNVGRAGYEGFVSRLQKHIVGGDIIQAVPSQRMRHDLAPGVTSVDLYRQLRRTNPSPYMFLLELGNDGTASDGSAGADGLSVIGASPEMLCKVTAEGEVETHPIAGTRRRGRTAAEDDAMAADLIGDPKERAEHVMLVDLGRNDCGRVCAAGTVKVERLMGIERYSHVMHIVSRVTGRLAEDKTSMDAFRSIFPAGTVSGAPKVRAIELVAGMEPEKRYVYAGAVGCWGYDGALDTAIAIRTVFVTGGSAYLQAGGGIVYDSVPQAEYIETINKLAASMKAVDAAVDAARLV